MRLNSYHLRLSCKSLKLRRFLQKDSVLFIGRRDLYSYTGCDFVNYGDWWGLKCIYYQSSGLMVCIGDNTGKEYYREKGYSGYGQGKNNPDMQHIPNVGPIPRGLWRLGNRWYNHPRLGKNVINLVPLPGNTCYNTQRECDTFRIHGDSLRNPGNASHGCIVLPPNRVIIPPGEILEVVK
ncbi:tlde1 domain-containing protein [Persephonella sp.]